MKPSIDQRIRQHPGLSLFAQSVYRVVACIPRGHVMTYAEVARRVGNPKAARAVGRALHVNPFAPDVPCHRVIRSDGTLGGFALGIRAKKEHLLKEGVVVYT
mgnify:CR=1 FL=1